MFFFLSKTISFLFTPLAIILILLITGLVVNRKIFGRRLVITGVALLWILSNDFLANEVMRRWEIEVTPFDSMSKTYVYGILLTGVTRNDLQPDDRVYFSHGADRVVHTAELYRRGIIQKIIVSGGVGRLMTYGRPEADELKQVLMLMGVPEENILIENGSRNTYESALHVKEILVQSGTSDALLITSAFHMRRSKACFVKQGMNLDTFSTDFYTHPRHYTPDTLFVPNADALVVWSKLWKEWTGMIAYKAAGYI